MIGGSTVGGGIMTAQIEWWTNADPLEGDQWWRRATRAEVEALQPPDACYAVLLGCDGLTVIRSGMIPVACDVPVRLWTVGPWQTEVYTVQATEYAAVLREVETRLTEIDAMAAAGPRDGATRLDPRELRKALQGATP